MKARTHRIPTMFTAAAITLFGAGIATSVAQIVATAGAAQVQSPNDVTEDQNEDDQHIQAIDENQCITLQNDLVTDQGVIPAGTEVSCHLLRFDPTMMNVTLQGTVRFDGPILGVISSSAGLDASDDPCADLANVTYPPAGTEPARGLEPPPQVDAYQRLDECTIRARTEVTTAQDMLRVVTRCCDEGQECCEG